MLSTAGLAVLDALVSGREATVRELADETGYSRKQVYRVVDDLRDAGLLSESRGNRNRRVVRPTDNPVVEAYRHLASKLGHVEWPELLSPATVRVSWYLDEPRRVTEIAERLGITRQGVHKALSPLKDLAMLAPDGPEYALADDLQPALAFARAVVTHEHRTRVRDLAPSATIEWCDPKRALVRVHEPEDTEALRGAADWEVSGLAKFREFGLQFYLGDEPAFWYGPDDLSPAEVVCLTLVLDYGPRRVGYAMLLIEEAGIEEETLAAVAKWYDLQPVVSAMYRRINGDPNADDVDDRLPSAAEYASLKDQYRVS